MNAFEEKLEQCWSFARWRESGVVLAVSGGADSVAMLRAFVSVFRFFSNHSDDYSIDHSADDHSDDYSAAVQENISESICAHSNNYSIDELSEIKTVRNSIYLGRFGRKFPGVIAHLNHSLRGQESDNDALFVRHLADSLQVPYIEKKLDPYWLEKISSGSLEATARDVRYRFLLDAAEKYGCRYVAVAHTADDQIETLLQRIFRGTGLQGLAGIRSCRPLNEAVSLVRPLLTFRRQELRDYLTEKNQSFREDSSNAENDFVRNRIRNQLVPAISKTVGSGWQEALLRLSSVSAEAENLLQAQAESLFEKYVRLTDSMSNPVEPSLDNKSDNKTLSDRKCDHFDKNENHRCLFENQAGDFVSNVSLNRKQTAIISTKFLLSEADYLLQELFLLVWTRQNWHLQEMGVRQWKALVQQIRGSESSQRFYPGDICAQFDLLNQQLILSKKDVK